jgi:predicted  nucleic acid-binding Zn-ribbon protein
MDVITACLLCGVSLVAIAVLVIQCFKYAAEIDVLKWQLKTTKSDRDFFEERCVRWQQDYHSLKEELAAQKSAPDLQPEVDRLNERIVGYEQLSKENFERNRRLRDQIISLEAKLNSNNHEIAHLKIKATLKSESKLTEAMSGLCRFIAANQWMLEKNKELRDSLESVREVSNSVESFRTDF